MSKARVYFVDDQKDLAASLAVKCADICATSGADGCLGMFIDATDLGNSSLYAAHDPCGGAERTP